MGEATNGEKLSSFEKQLASFDIGQLRNSVTGYLNPQQRTILPNWPVAKGIWKTDGKGLAVGTLDLPELSAVSVAGKMLVVYDTSDRPAGCGIIEKDVDWKFYCQYSCYYLDDFKSGTPAIQGTPITSFQIDYSAKSGYFSNLDNFRATVQCCPPGYVTPFFTSIESPPFFSSCKCKFLSGLSYKRHESVIHEEKCHPTQRPNTTRPRCGKKPKNDDVLETKELKKHHEDTCYSGVPPASITFITAPTEFNPT